MRHDGNAYAGAPLGALIASDRRDRHIGALLRVGQRDGVPVARPAAEWADLSRQGLRSTERGDTPAFSVLIGAGDNLAAISQPVRVALSVTPPAPCGDVRFDAAATSWVREPPRVLMQPRIVPAHTDPADVPNAFGRHGVPLAASELVSV